MSKQRENQIYQLILPVLEKRYSDKIQLIEKPDDYERNKEAIDFISKGRIRFYLTEHTFIENQTGRKRDDAHFTKLLGPLEKNLYKKLNSPGFYYQVAVEMGAVKGAKKTKEIQESLQSWIIEKKDQLQANKAMTEKPEGVPFKVTLSKHKAVIPEIDGRLLISRIAPEAEVVEKLRRERIESALAKKLPKLYDIKIKKPDAKTILILESNDIALSNHVQISEAVIEELSKRKDVPDDIYLIEMEIEEKPIVWILKEGDKLFPEINNSGPHYLDVLGI